ADTAPQAEAATEAPAGNADGATAS
ncbi:MAG: hypothetical protein QOE53_299, partial [Pseudonocardiales bacterium]|nr:hypothetical protein [Pseudonocardiales bacterium]